MHKKRQRRPERQRFDNLPINKKAEIEVHQLKSELYPKLGIDPSQPIDLLELLDMDMQLDKPIHIDRPSFICEPPASSITNEGFTYLLSIAGLSDSEIRLKAMNRFLKFLDGKLFSESSMKVEHICKKILKITCEPSIKQGLGIFDDESFYQMIQRLHEYLIETFGDSEVNPILLKEALKNFLSDYYTS